MLVLAFESATERSAVALADERGLIAAVTLSGGRRHAESIAPAVEFVCRSSGATLGELDGVCVDVGPGLFTGLRVGIASAKGLAFGLGIPVACATSLEILAHALAASGHRPGALLVPVIDARRGEVFSARFAFQSGSVGSSGLVRLEDEALWAPEALAEALRGASEPLVLCGNGAIRYASLFAEVPGAIFASSQLASPPVEMLATIGVERLVAGSAVDARAVLPRYLREADVRINWEQRLAPRASSTAVS